MQFTLKGTSRSTHSENSSGLSLTSELVRTEPWDRYSSVAGFILLTQSEKLNY